MLGKSPIKWRQHPDITIAVDWDVKHQFEQAIQQTSILEDRTLYLFQLHWLFSFIGVDDAALDTV